MGRQASSNALRNRRSCRETGGALRGGAGRGGRAPDGPRPRAEARHRTGRAPQGRVVRLATGNLLTYYKCTFFVRNSRYDVY